MTCGSCCGDKFGTGCGGCKAIVAIAALVLTLLAIASLIGVYNTHVTPDGWVFGSLNGSMAILTLTITLLGWLKLVKKLCPCGKVCAMCGKSPCVCG